MGVIFKLCRFFLDAFPKMKITPYHFTLAGIPVTQSDPTSRKVPCRANQVFRVYSLRRGRYPLREYRLTSRMLSRSIGKCLSTQVADLPSNLVGIGLICDVPSRYIVLWGIRLYFVSLTCCWT